MSRANLFVRMPDGEVRYGIYNGTIDMAETRLYDTPAQAWDGWHDGTSCDRDAEPGAGEPVIVATDYGGDGWAWEATATRDHLMSGTEPYETDGEFLPMPEWARYPKAAQ